MGNIIKGAGSIGADTKKIAKTAIMTAVKAADEVESEAGGCIRKALLVGAILGVK